MAVTTPTEKSPSDADGIHRRPYVWPTDYVPLDDGAMLVRPDFVETFRQMGWSTLSAIMNSDRVEVVRDMGTRDNCIVRFDTPAGSVGGFLKRHRIRSLDDWLRERRGQRAADTPGLAEADASEWCRQADVATVNIIAAGQRFAADGSRNSDSFFLSEDLVNCVPSCEFWSTDPDSRLIRAGIETNAPSFDYNRKRILEAIAATARRFHAAGLFHHDFYLEHFFIDLRQVKYPQQQLTPVLLDLQRVEKQTAPWARCRAQIKDLGQFQHSCRRHRLTDEEQLLWKQHYLGNETSPKLEFSSGESFKFAAAAARGRIRKWRREALKTIRGHQRRSA